MQLTSAILHIPEPGEIPPVTAVGAKARNLALLASGGLPVPRWIALTPEAAGLDPDRLHQSVAVGLRAAGLAGKRLAVRSSSLVEDGTANSYAGQYTSILGVPSDDARALSAAIRQVWQSAGSAHLSAYHSRTATEAEAARIAVLLQEMVLPVVSGVAFSADPLTGDRSVVTISAVYGLGEGLVSGLLDADTFRFRRAETGPIPIDRSIARKDRAVMPAPEGGTAIVNLHESWHETVTLSDADLLTLARAVEEIEGLFDTPQDIEWAFVGDGESRRLVILQARPITALPAQQPGELRVWDNSNIVESYAGVTTPLTFSFARHAYEEVYLQFCRLMGVSEALLERHSPVFAHMLGHLQGRIYYNLLNWYRALSLLPGYSFNRSFMERMMGVRQKLENPPEPPYVAEKTADLFRLLRMTAGLVREQIRLPAEIRRFHARVERVLAPLAGEDLKSWPVEELAALYRRVEKELLGHWQAPLVNDFLAMIYFGVLGRLVEKWLPAAPRTLCNDLLCGEGGMISTEPARHAIRLGRKVAASPALRQLFDTETADDAVWERLRSGREYREFHAEIETYLSRFGDRCANELKLETVTLKDDPAGLIRMVRSYASPQAAGGEAEEAPVWRGRAAEVRQQAESRADAELRRMRRRIFFRVLEQTRRRVRDRENLRFERTRVFGLARRIFQGLGEGLVRQGVLAESRDIYYLTKEEIFALLEGCSATADPQGVVRARRAEYDRYQQLSPLPDRFETTGPPLTALRGRSMAGAPPAASGREEDGLTGLGCCPGVVRAPVCIVRDVRTAPDLTGKILVAERTDPGWTPLFPAAAGILVQRGSLLSHSAIVAREMGIPCVVSVPRLLERLADGEWVEMDGAAGTIARLGEHGQQR